MKNIFYEILQLAVPKVVILTSLTTLESLVP